LNGSTPKLTKHSYADETICLFHGIDEATGNPDWLGEIFEWLSSSHEMSLQGRDAVGRIPYSEMIFTRENISPRKPYATFLMSWMENVLRNGPGIQALPKAPSPLPGIEHIVVCSHDIDFYYVDKKSTLLRLIKNLGISFRLYGSFSYFSSNSAMILELLGGKRVGDYLPALLEAIEKCDFQSTLFVVPCQKHRRDPNYRLEALAPHLALARKKGFPVSVHASYNSIIENDSLESEVAALEKTTGQKPIGSRQHWLRFDQHRKLFEAIEREGLLFDSSLGFAEMVGFRNGASFAFPPYDFRKEKPHEFLEIPIALMDGNLESTARLLKEDPQELADEILEQSRKWGWGGIATLWHNPMEALSVPKEINNVFWNCARRQRKHGEKWMSAESFLSCSLERYRAAGLLQGVKSAS